MKQLMRPRKIRMLSIVGLLTTTGVLAEFSFGGEHETFNMHADEVYASSQLNAQIKDLENSLKETQSLQQAYVQREGALKKRCEDLSGKLRTLMSAYSKAKENAFEARKDQQLLAVSAQAAQHKDQQALDAKYKVALERGKNAEHEKTQLQAKIVTLQEELRQIVKEKKEIHAQLAAQHGKQEKLQQENRQLLQQLVSIKKEKEDVLAQNSRLARDFAGVRKEQDSLVVQLNKEQIFAQQERERLEKKYVQCVQQLKELEVGQEKLNQELAKSQKEAQGMQQIYDREIKEAHSYIEKFQKDHMKAEKELTRAQAKAEELASNNAKLKSEIEISSKAYMQLCLEQQEFKKQIDAFQKEAQAYQAKISLQNREKSTLSEHADLLKKELLALQESNNCVSKMHEKTLQQLAMLEEKHSALLAKHQPMKQEVARLTKEKTLIQEEYAKLSTQCQQLSEELAVLSNEHAPLKKEHMQVLKEKKQLQRDYVKVENDLAQLATKHAEVQKKYKPLREALTLVAKEKEELMHDYEQVCEQSDRLTNNVAELYNKYVPLQTEYAALVQERDRLERDYVQAKDAYSLLASQHNELQREHAPMASQLVALSQEVSDLRKEKQDVLRECKRAQAQCNTLVAELHEARTKGAPAYAKEAMRAQQELKSAHDERVRELALVREELAAMSKSYKGAQDQVAQLSKSVDVVKANAVALSAERMRLIEQVRQYENRCAELLDQNKQLLAETRPAMNAPQEEVVVHTVDATYEQPALQVALESDLMPAQEAISTEPESFPQAVEIQPMFQEETEMAMPTALEENSADDELTVEADSAVTSSEEIKHAHTRNEDPCHSCPTRRRRSLW